MSYSLSIVHDNGEVAKVEVPFNFGTTHSVPSDNFLEIGVTYNYCEFFQEVFGKDGIRSIYGMPMAESIRELARAVSIMSAATLNVKDYWEATEGNARKALLEMLRMACNAPPDCIWEGHN